MIDTNSNNCYCFKLAGPRYQYRRKGRNVRSQIHHVHSRKGEDQHVPECLTKVLSRNTRVEDQKQGVSAERSKYCLHDAFRLLFINDAGSSEDVLTVPHQSGRGSLKSTSQGSTATVQDLSLGLTIDCLK